MAKMNVMIKFDASEVHQAVESVCKTGKAQLAKGVKNGFLRRLRQLGDSGLPDGCIVVLSSTSNARDHVIRLGVGGELEILAAAVRTGKFDI